MMGDCGGFRIRMKRYGTCEVALRKKVPGGLFIDKQTKFPSAVNLPENLVLKLESGGTAFVFQRLPDPIEVESTGFYGVGFALSAAHVACNAHTYNRLWKMKACEFEGKSQGLFLLYLSSFLKKFPEVLSTKSGTPYCLPGNIGVFLILSPIKLIDLADVKVDYECNISPGTKCTVSGFPLFDGRSVKYAYPFENDPLKAFDRLSSVFHGGNRLVCSTGKVLNCGQVLELSCTSMNGMSGSPALSGGKIVGVLVGGTALPGQYELIRSAQFAKMKYCADAWTSYKRFLEYKSLYLTPSTDFSEEILEIFALLFLEENQPIPSDLPNLDECNISRLKNEIVDPALFLSDFLCEKSCDLMFLWPKKDELSYNIAIPSSNICIRTARTLCERFEQDCSPVMSYSEILSLWLSY